MFGSLFGKKSETLTTALRDGAIIIDVRSPQEFAGGHVAGSTNIPLQNLGNQLSRFSPDVPIVFCCASGGRSGAATDAAVRAGLAAINGGPWTAVNRAVADLEKENI